MAISDFWTVAKDVGREVIDYEKDRRSASINADLIKAESQAKVAASVAQTSNQKYLYVALAGLLVVLAVSIIRRRR
jgi:hypothetical protein